MAFLDNNIITLDAVLTDVGRKRLAQGNGSFRVSQFALGDDEINYGLFNPNNASGSAYYDLNILQTPVFEAMTNSSTALKSNLMTLNDNTLLYLPILKLNTLLSGKSQYNGSYVVIANDTAYTTIVGSSNTNPLTNNPGFTDGRGITSTNRTGAPTIVMQIDQGVDNASFGAGPNGALPTNLAETQFSVYANNLFLEPVDSTGASTTAIVANNIYNSLDNTAIYNLTLDTTPNYFTSAPQSNLSPIAGPKGSSVQLGLKGSTTLLNNLSYYFTKYGSTTQTNFAGVSGLNVKVISTSVKLKGMSLGYTISIPVQIIAQF